MARFFNTYNLVPEPVPGGVRRRVGSGRRTAVHAQIVQSPRHLSMAEAALVALPPDAVKLIDRLPGRNTPGGSLGVFLTQGYASAGDAVVDEAVEQFKRRARQQVEVVIVAAAVTSATRDLLSRLGIPAVVESHEVAVFLHACRASSVGCRSTRGGCVPIC
jgi:hypothetical protein